MRVKLTSELKAYCAEHKIVISDGMELDDSKLSEARQMWSRQHPDKDAEEIEIHAIGLVASQVKVAQKSGELFLVPPAEQKREWKDAAWKIAVLILLLLIAIREGHAQIDVIKVQDNVGAAVGTIAAPFTFKAGANCTWAKSASTYTFNCAGGAAGAGGLSGQAQWNSTGSLAGISSLTTDGTVVTALAGADWLFADLTTPTKKFQFDASNISAVTTRTMNVPDANATFAQAIAAVSHKFVTQMSAQGVFTLAQPDYSDLTGTPQLPVTIANASHKWLNSYTSGTGAFTQTQPDYSDLTGTPTLPANTTATASNFFTAYNSTTGAFTKAQPLFSDLSGSISVAQSQSLSGDVTGAVNAAVVGKVNGVTFAASPSTDTIPVITAANTATYKAVPDCQDSSGNHLNYTASTHAISCGTTSSGGGSTSSGANSYVMFPMPYLLSGSLANVSMGSTTQTGVYLWYWPETQTVATVSWGMASCAGGGHDGIAVYSADGSTRLLTTGANVCSGTQNIAITPVTISQGFVRIVWTTDNVSDQFYGYTQSTVVLNQNNATLGTAANASAAGAPPTTTGVITGTSANAIAIKFGG